ncbi:glycosyltransferase [Xenorhabdus ehlersii]|uniref:Polysaccharide biosynthesis protein/putative rhamnosyl transferase n=1 Tax=Xenorhabdus ehlersii TaxID=290111 RepID=A0A2D0IK20_9GAMM|nr:glycosyltransferase [Xenorhabdus ehlersii]PHM22113.1 polysaccharide biosynthesis protein/putative rhamnosyl transferase [Xenorhabdus ehlersii]RKE93330.1 rhamnosyltransferase [Xenorhabdus ehlersii]
MKNKVLVLLAAYNGKKWILEQIQSILDQDNVDVSILISVDESSDGTEQLVQELAYKNEKIKFLPMGEKFGGAAKNFFRLMIEADAEQYNYISFADQDDIWYVDKLNTAINHLNTNDFYSSDVTAFWDDGRTCNIIKSQPFVKYDFIFEAAGPGCTYVMKRDAFIKAQRFIIDNKCRALDFSLHDWFLYAFARANNLKWFIDNKPSMLYRQHANNQVGANNSIKAIIKRLKLIKLKWYRTEVEKLISLLSLNDEKFVCKALHNGYSGNLYLLFNIHKVRRRMRDRILLGFVLLINVF